MASPPLQFTHPIFPQSPWLGSSDVSTRNPVGTGRAIFFLQTKIVLHDCNDKTFMFQIKPHFKL